MNDTYFMKKALQVAREALIAGEFPVGCVLTSGDKILATTSRTGTAPDAVNEIDHAEMLALRKLADLRCPASAKITLYSTLEPCLMCFGAIVLSGIDKLVYAYEDVMGGGTGCDLTRMPPLYQQLGISITPHVLRNESLALFKAYFANPKTLYWQGSLLATYTLDQSAE